MRRTLSIAPAKFNLGLGAWVVEWSLCCCKPRQSTEWFPLSFLVLFIVLPGGVNYSVSPVCWKPLYSQIWLLVCHHISTSYLCAYKLNLLLTEFLFFLIYSLYWAFSQNVSTQWGKPQYKKKRKSSDNVTRGPAPPAHQLVTAWGCVADPPSSDSLGVRSWPPIVSVIHGCFNSEGHQIWGVT